MRRASRADPHRCVSLSPRSRDHRSTRILRWEIDCHRDGAMEAGSMRVSGAGGCGGKWPRVARERYLMLPEQLLDAGDVGTHERSFGNHQRLMAVADVIGEQRPGL